MAEENFWKKETRQLQIYHHLSIPFIRDDNVILAIVILIENYLVHF